MRLKVAENLFFLVFVEQFYTWATSMFGFFGFFGTVLHFQALSFKLGTISLKQDKPNPMDPHVLFQDKPKLIDPYVLF